MDSYGQANPRKKKTRKGRVKQVEKRVSASLSRWLKKQNPAMKKAAAVRIQKLKGGVIKLIPVRRRNVAQGYYDATGFHPIRSSWDYDPDCAGDEYESRPKKRAKSKKSRKR